MTDPSPQPTPNGPIGLARLLAVVAPALVLGLAIMGFAQPPEKNLSEDALAVEASLAEAPPDVVLVGNSMLRFGVDEPQLAKTMNAPVSKLALNGSSAQVWYLVLKNRVFGNGHTPHAILVLGTARTLLATEPLSALENVNAAGQREPIEPVIDTKVQGNKPIELLWAQWRRDLLRSRILDGIRTHVAQWLFTEEVESYGTDADTWAKAQLDEVFGGEEDLIGATASRVIPVVEAQRQSHEPSTHTVADTFLPDFVELAKKHGTRLVFVRMPVAASGPMKSNAYELSDGPVEALWQDTLTWMSEQDVGYVDLRNTRLDDADFVDFLHANQKGRKKITEQLGKQLRHMGLMGNEPLPRVVNLSPSEMKRTGPVPDVVQPKHEHAKRKSKDCHWEVPNGDALALAAGPLTQLGIAAASPLTLYSQDRLIPQASTLSDVTATPCTGTAFIGKRSTVYNARKPSDDPADMTLRIDPEFPGTGMDGNPTHWIFPGQSVTATFPSAWPDAAGTFQISLSATQVHTGPPLQIHVGSESFDGRVVGGHSVEATIQPVTPDDAWTLRLAVPPDGSPTLIQSLGIGEGFSATWLIGQPTVLASHRAVGNRRGTVRFDAAPPPIEFDPPQETADGLVVFKNQALSFMGDDYVFQTAGLWSCSPVQLTLDGKPFGKGHRRCGSVPSLPAGSYCHTKSTIRLKPPRDNHPMTEPDRWNVRLHPDRICSTRRWLFPGDVMTANPWRKDTASMTRGIRSIQLSGFVVDPIQGKKTAALRDPAQLVATVTVHHEGQVLLSHTLTRAELNGENQQFAVDPPVFPSEEPVFFVFETDTSAPYTIVSSASVSEQTVVTSLAVNE